MSPTEDKCVKYDGFHTYGDKGMGWVGRLLVVDFMYRVGCT